MDISTLGLFGLLAVALFALVKGADYFIDGSKEVGATLGLSPFVIGIVVVGFGTSLPELASSFLATLSGSADFAIATVVGSNITNILLIAGLLIAIGGRIVVERDLVRTELPIFLIATAAFLYVARDGSIVFIESILLLITFVSYLWYLIYEARSIDDVEVTASTRGKKISLRTVLFLIGGLAAVVVGAHFTVEAVLGIAEALAIPASLITITAVAVGTSLPELAVSLRALMKEGGIDLALGNIFGSNVFNALIVIGIPGLFSTLTLDATIASIGIPALIMASALFFVTGLSRQFLRWQGFVFVAFFFLFLYEIFATPFVV